MRIICGNASCLIKIILLVLTFTFFSGHKGKDFSSLACAAEKNKIVLKVGVHEGQPMIFKDPEDGKVKGFCLDILKSIAQKHGWKLEYVFVSWSKCVSYLKNGKIDILFPILRSKTRNKYFDFTHETLFTPWGRIFAQQSSHLDSILNLDGKIVGVTKGDIFNEELRNLIAKFNLQCKFVEFDSSEKTLAALHKGLVEAVGLGTSGHWMAHDYPSIKPTGVVYSPGSAHFATRKGKLAEIRKILDYEVANLKKDRNSLYYKSHSYWFAYEKTYTFPKWLFWLLTVGASLLIVFVTFSAILRAQVNSKTREISLRAAQLEAEIAERKKAEKRLERLGTAVEQAAEAVYITDTLGTIVYVNPAFEKASGYKARQIIGQNASLLHGEKEDQGVKRSVYAYLGQGKVWQGHLTNRRKNGTFYDVAMTASPVRDPNGKITDFVILQRDITREKELEKRLRAAQKMEAMGTLASGIAHDFNNLLSVIMGFTQLAQQKLAKKSQEREDLEEATAAGIQARNLVKQILTFCRQGEQEIIPLNLTPLIKEVVKFLRATLPSTIEIKQAIFNHQGRVMADPSQIQQVLMNICTNAAQAMEYTGGVLTVALSSFHLDESKATTYPDLKPGNYLNLTISDTGPGIDMEVKERIFEPFFTTKEPGKGTGMGLAVVHGIISRINGHIQVTSEKGKGTEFEVLFPLTDEIAPDPYETLDKNVPTGTEKILVVDDEPSVLKAQKLILDQLGYTVTAFSDSLKAFEFFKEKNGDFDLLITDYTMPKMTGLELIAKIREVEPEIKVILCTGFSELSPQEIMAKVKVSGFLFKPVLVDKLAREVRTAIDGKSIS